MEVATVTLFLKIDFWDVCNKKSPGAKSGRYGGFSSSASSSRHMARICAAQRKIKRLPRKSSTLFRHKGAYHRPRQGQQQGCLSRSVCFPWSSPTFGERRKQVGKSISKRKTWLKLKVRLRYDCKTFVCIKVISQPFVLIFPDKGVFWLDCRQGGKQSGSCAKGKWDSRKSKFEDRRDNGK